MNGKRRPTRLLGARQRTDQATSGPAAGRPQPVASNSHAHRPPPTCYDALLLRLTLAPLRSLLDRARARIQTGLSLADPIRALILDRPTLSAWLRYRAAIAEGLGPDAADAYTRLIVAALEHDPRLSRALALSVPDHLARVDPAARATYLQLLHQVLAAEPTAVPMAARALPELVGRLDADALPPFLAEALALHRRSPHRAESFLRQESRRGQAAARTLSRGLALTEVSRTLTLYARAHCGADVQIRPGNGQSFTDGHHLYLPESVDAADPTHNFLVYRVKTALSAGYLEFGTFDLDLDELGGNFAPRQEGEAELERFFAGFPNRSLGRDLFQALEDARVIARIRHEYPGVARDLDALGPALWGARTEPAGGAARVVEALIRAGVGLPPLSLNEAESASIEPLLSLLPQLAEPTTTVRTVARAVMDAYPAVAGLMRRAEPRPPEPRPPEPARSPRSGGRSGGERAPTDTARPEGYQSQPDQFPSGLRPEDTRAEDRSVEDDARRILDRMRAAGEPADLAQARRTARGRNSEDRDYRRMEAMMEHAHGGGAVVPDNAPGEERPQAPGPAQAADPDADAVGRPVLYREWDTTIEDYKPGWVRVYEHRLKGGSRERVDEVLIRERGPIELLRRRFEALRPQGLARVRRLTDGNDLDLDRAIEDEVAARVGQERSERVYTRDDRTRRDVAVAFLLDMSSSTNESADGSARRIIDVEKDALIVVAEALHALGDPFAIYGFSGYGRDHVAFYIAKDFGDAYDGHARERIGRISFKMENRDGAAIRHATRKLMARPARSRLLILLSDGKPLDCGCDHYYDRYAQEDTRAALREARRDGVHPFCITVDPSGGDYLARMYGDVAYTVIDRVDKLPARLVAIYKKLAL